MLSRAPDDLSTPHGAWLAGHLHVVSHGGQLRYDLLRHPRVNLYALFADPLEAGSVQALLRIHMVVDGVYQYLHVSLRLHESAHNAKGADGLSILAQKTGDNGVIALFASFDAIVAAGVKAEIVAAILQ